MKQLLHIFLFVLAGASFVFGQDFIYDLDKKSKSDVEVYKEGEGKYKKLVLIAYKPVMHLPDPAGDMELLVHSGKDLDAFHKYVRMGLDLRLAEEFKSGYSVISLLRNADEETKRDLERIYGSVSYDYVERPLGLDEKKKPGKIIKERLAPKDDSPGRDAELTIRDGQLSSRKTDRSEEYMNVSIKDSTLLPYLVNKYDAEIFVFLNQFELKKLFVKGEDVAYNKYGREVIVHYSVIDKTGKQLYGNAATDNIEAKYDNINEIINMTFPNISKEMFGHIPGGHQSEVLQKLEKKYQEKAESQDILRKN